MFRYAVTAIAALALATPAVAREASPLPASDNLAGFNDRVLTYVLIGALIAAIVIATADEGSDGDDIPASP